MCEIRQIDRSHNLNEVRHGSDRFNDVQDRPDSRQCRTRHESTFDGLRHNDICQSILSSKSDDEKGGVSL